MNSTKSIIDKLSLTKYPAKLVLNKPEDITDFNGIEYDSSMEKERYDAIFVFIFNLQEFSQYTKQVVEKQLLNDNGYLFFAYQKKIIVNMMNI